MHITSFNSCLALCTIFSFVSAQSSADRSALIMKKRNAALDAASSAQSATTYLVCTLSFQTKSAAYSLGIGSAPTQCIQPTSTSPAGVVTTPNVIPSPLPTTATSGPDTFLPCSATNPTSCEITRQALTGHNTFRAIHHVDALVWNDTLAHSALAWAQNAKWGHSNQTLYPTPYGENLWASSMSYPGTTMNQAMQAFNVEEALYDYRNPGFSEETGHFTQVVWKGTQQVGCAVATVNLDIFSAKTSTSSYYVCHYTPAGNYIGEFAENVFAP